MANFIATELEIHLEVKVDLKYIGLPAQYKNERRPISLFCFAYVKNMFVDAKC